MKTERWAANVAGGGRGERKKGRGGEDKQARKRSDSLAKGKLYRYTHTYTHIMRERERDRCKERDLLAVILIASEEINTVCSLHHRPHCCLHTIKPTPAEPTSQQDGQIGAITLEVSQHPVKMSCGVQVNASS